MAEKLTRDLAAVDGYEVLVCALTLKRQSSCSVSALSCSLLRFPRVPRAVVLGSVAPEEGLQRCGAQLHKRRAWGQHHDCSQRATPEACWQAWSRTCAAAGRRSAQSATASAAGSRTSTARAGAQSTRRGRQAAWRTLRARGAWSRPCSALACIVTFRNLSHGSTPP